MLDRLREEELRLRQVMTQETDLLELLCDSIEKNKQIGIYDGAYKCVELATGRKWER